MEYNLKEYFLGLGYRLNDVNDNRSIVTPFKLMEALFAYGERRNLSPDESALDLLLAGH